MSASQHLSSAGSSMSIPFASSPGASSVASKSSAGGWNNYTGTPKPGYAGGRGRSTPPEMERPVPVVGGVLAMQVSKPLLLLGCTAVCDTR